MTAKDSPTAAELAQVQGRPSSTASPGNLGYIDGTAKITLFDAHGDPVISWALQGCPRRLVEGAAPRRMSSKVAVEQLTLIHEGFA